MVLVVNISREALGEATYVVVGTRVLALCLNGFDSFHERTRHGMIVQ